jgi:CheY-like chemotaxis protein
VVEDVPDTAEVLRLELTQWGYENRVCTSAHEALALAPYFKPQVVLIDIGLPDMNGWELARRFHEQETPETPVFIALTARGEKGDFERSQSVGIRFHLVKPSYHAQLRDLLARFG